MSSNANALRSKPAGSVSPVVAEKVRALTSKAQYEEPKVVSFPLNEMKTAHALSLAGNG